MQRKTGYYSITFIILSLVVFMLPMAVFGVDSEDMLSLIGTNAGMIGIGGIEGVLDSPSAVFENPARLYYISEFGSSIFNTTVLDEFNFININVGIPTDYGKIGFGYMQEAIGNLPLTAVDRYDQFYVIGNFEYKRYVMAAAYENTLAPNLFAGVTLKYYGMEMYTYSGRGVNADVGLLWVNPLDSTSLTFRNVIAGRDFVLSTGTIEKLPFELLLSHQLNFKKILVTNDQIQLYSQARYMPNNAQEKLFLSAGIKLLPYIFHNMFYLSAGYKQFPVNDGLKSTMVMGLGVDFDSVGFQFAFEPTDFAETYNKYYFSISINLQKESGIQPPDTHSMGFSREEYLKRQLEKEKKSAIIIPRP